MEKLTLQQIVFKHRGETVSKDFTLTYQSNYVCIKDNIPYVANVLVRANKSIRWKDGYLTLAKFLVDGKETSLNLFKSSVDTSSLKLVTDSTVFISVGNLLTLIKKEKELADNYKRLAEIKYQQIDYYQHMVDKFPEELI